MERELSLVDSLTVVDEDRDVSVKDDSELDSLPVPLDDDTTPELLESSTTTTTDGDSLCTL